MSKRLHGPALLVRATRYGIRWRRNGRKTDQRTFRKVLETSCHLSANELTYQRLRYIYVISKVNIDTVNTAVHYSTLLLKYCMKDQEGQRAPSPPFSWSSGQYQLPPTTVPEPTDDNSYNRHLRSPKRRLRHRGLRRPRAQWPMIYEHARGAVPRHFPLQQGRPVSGGSSRSAEAIRQGVCRYGIRTAKRPALAVGCGLAWEIEHRVRRRRARNAIMDDIVVCLRWQAEEGCLEAWFS